MCVCDCFMCISLLLEIKCHPSVYEDDGLQLPKEVTNYMRVIFAIQVVLAKDVREYILARFPPDIYQNEILIDKLLHGILPQYIPTTSIQAYTPVTLSYTNRILMPGYFYDRLLSDIFNLILNEKNRIVLRGSTNVTEIDMIESFSHLIQISEELNKLKLQINLPIGNLVATLKYYQTCCMDEQISSWYHESLIDLAEKEQQFGTSRHFPNQGKHI